MARLRALAGHEAAITAAYKAGTSTYELADRYGVSYRSILRLLAAAGIEMRPANRPSDLLGREDEAVKLYDEGLTYREVGERLGVSAETVGRVIRSRGSNRKRGRAALVGHERKIVDAYLAGATSESLAADYGVSFHTIRAVLRERGVTLRTGRPPRR